MCAVIYYVRERKIEKACVILVEGFFVNISSFLCLLTYKYLTPIFSVSLHFFFTFFNLKISKTVLGFGLLFPSFCFASLFICVSPFLSLCSYVSLSYVTLFAFPLFSLFATVYVLSFSLFDRERFFLFWLLVLLYHCLYLFSILSFIICLFIARVCLSVYNYIFL